MQLCDEVVQAIAVDLILTADMALQADAVQRHAAIEQAVDEPAESLALLRRLAVETFEIVFVDKEFCSRIDAVRDAERHVDVFLAEV